MPRSPKLTQGETAQLTKVQGRGLQKASDAVADAADKVDALKTKKRSKQEEVQRLRGHLSAIDEKLTMHPLTQKRADKSEEIAISKSELQDVIDELARAKASLEEKLLARDDKVSALKIELAEDDDSE
jgi:DNA-directed RNA polymerase alpha subunit